MDWLDKLAVSTVAADKITGVHVHLLADGQMEISCVLLEKKKAVVSVLEKKEVSSLADLTKLVDKDVPVSLSVDGKGILTKKINFVGESSPIKEVLPQAEEDDFYYNLLQDEADHSIISLARKDLVNAVLEPLVKDSLELASVTLGPLSVQTIAPFLGEGYQAVELPNYTIQIKDTQITSVQATKNERVLVAVGEEKLENMFVQPYANAVSKMLKVEVFAASSLSFYSLEWQHKKLFKKVGIGVLAFFFLLLLLNFLLFQSLSEKNSQLVSQLSQNQFQLAKLKSLEEKAREQERLQQTVGIGKQTFFSFYADRLASTIKGDITLTDLIIQPPVKDGKSKTYLFQPGIVEVKGLCNKPVMLNDWIKSLEKQDWVKEISNQRYTTLVQEGDGAFSFYIKVNRL